MGQLFNTLGELLSQPGIWVGVCHEHLESLSPGSNLKKVDAGETRVIVFGFPVRVSWRVHHTIDKKPTPILPPL